MFDPDANLARLNRNMVYLGACLIAGMRLARQKQVNVRVIPTIQAIEELRGSRPRGLQPRISAGTRTLQ